MKKNNRLTSNRITSTDYANPYRPSLLQSLNYIGDKAAHWNLRISLDRESLLKAAMRAEKYDDFGDEAFLLPFDVLLRSIEQEAELNFVGRFITRQRIINLLRNRLRVSRLLKKHPEIKQIPIDDVILITGLQRTGTTILHRLLAEDPENRALLAYEGLNPAPCVDDESENFRKKQRMAKQSERALAYMAPDFFAIHPVEWNAPEEDVLLLDYAFISTVAESTMNVPTYAKWVEIHDNRPAYEYMRTLMQVLSWKSPKRRWILKSPHHLEFLTVFLQVFPKTTVVRTHRDPCETLPSFCSMMCHGRGIFTDHVDPMVVGDHWLRKTARMVTRGESAITAVRPQRLLDIEYKAMLPDPLAQIKLIYNTASIGLEKVALRRMDKSLKINKQHRFGRHRYNMDSFGLSKERIYAAYGNYADRFTNLEKK